MIHDDDVNNVLQKDGVDLIDLHSFENNTCTSIEEVKEKFQLLQKHYVILQKKEQYAKSTLI